MERLDREELKREHPDWIIAIQQIHHMGPEIYQELYINHTPVENLGHSREYFVVLGDNQYFISYEMDHIIQNVELKIIARRLLAVTLYNSYQEYEAARFNALQSVKPDDQTGLNYN